MSNDDEYQQAQVTVETEEGQTEEYKLARDGVLITDALGNDVYVQPESVPVWLERGAKLK